MDEYVRKAKTYTPLQARNKAESYCAYQERSQQEVRDKLYDWGLRHDEVESIISYLIEENFLNEARFASAYVQGKFRMNGWGKIKIKQGLKHKKVSDPLIKSALNEIDSEEYRVKLIEILYKKNRTLNEQDPFKRRGHLFQYANGRGFESQFILEALTDNEFGF